MNKNLRWKVLLSIGVLILFGVVGVYPILASMYKLPAPQAILNKQLKLGLDLKATRDRLLSLSRSWTVLHPITDESPLRGATPESLHVDTVSDLEDLRHVVRDEDDAHPPIAQVHDELEHTR